MSFLKFNISKFVSNHVHGYDQMSELGGEKKYRNLSATYRLLAHVTFQFIVSLILKQILVIFTPPA